MPTDPEEDAVQESGLDLEVFFAGFRKGDSVPRNSSPPEAPLQQGPSKRRRFPRGVPEEPSPAAVPEDQEEDDRARRAGEGERSPWPDGKQIVPDHLGPGLRLIAVGLNPGLQSAAMAHHYSHPGNSFWPALFQSGLIPEPHTFKDDRLCFERYGIGFTNIVDRPTRGLEQLKPAELRAGGANLLRKLLPLRATAVLFNGVGTFTPFANPHNKVRLSPGVQDPELLLEKCKGPCPPGASPEEELELRGLWAEFVRSTVVFFVPNTSGRVTSCSREQRVEMLRELGRCMERAEAGRRAGEAESEPAEQDEEEEQEAEGSILSIKVNEGESDFFRRPVQRTDRHK